MAAALTFDRRAGGRAYKAYLDGLLADAGNPTDPVEVMLLEQMAFAHLRAADLHVKAAGGGALEAVELFAKLAARMSEEVRKSATALELYRASKAARLERAPGGRAG